MIQEGDDMNEEEKKKKEQEEFDKLFDDLFKKKDDKTIGENKDDTLEDDEFIKSLFDDKPIEDIKPIEEKNQSSNDDENFDWLKDLIDEIDKEEKEKTKQQAQNQVVQSAPAKPVKPSFTSKLKDKPRAPKPPEHIRMWGSGKKIVHTQQREDDKVNTKSNYKSLKYTVVTVALIVVSVLGGFFTCQYTTCDTKTVICKTIDVVLHKTYTGDKILIDTSLVNENGKKIIEQGYIDPHISNLMYNLVKPGSKVIDVGAGFGYYTFYLARIVGSSGKVYSIEARKNVAELLDASMRINRFTNIEVFNSVLFSDKVRVAVNVHDSKGISSFGINNIILQQDNLYGNTEVVTTTTLDVLFGSISNISMLNINANGNELSIILGAKNLIANSPNIKIITTWSKYEMSKYINIQNVVQQLLSNGFKFWLIKPSSGKLIELTKTEDIMQVERGRFLIAKTIE